MTQSPESSSAAEAAADLTLAADRFFPGGAMSPVTSSRHWMRVETDSGIAVVRQWPAETTRDHVEFVHAVQATAGKAGLTFVSPVLPLASEQSTVLVLNGRLYDARSWLPGEPLGRTEVTGTGGESADLPAVVSHAALLAAIEAIARFHQATAKLARHDQRLTIRQLRQAARQLWQVYRDRLRPVAPSAPAIQHWLRTGERALPMALALIDQAPELGQATSVVGHHRLWPAHVLRQQRDSGVAISGLVGLSDPAWGSPLLDLAQIATRFARWSPELVEQLIGTYSTVRQLVPAERRLLPAVATLDLLSQAGRLLDVAYGPAGGNASPPASPPLVVAAESLVATLEAISQTLTETMPSSRPSGLRRRHRAARGARPAKWRPGNLRQR